MRKVLFVVALVATLSLLGAPAAASLAAAEVAYAPPVDGEIVDGFRPPSSRYAVGNRGVDYETVPGDAVRAAADGTVVFAGRIGSSSHVVVLHADGIRTSYSFLDGATARRGDRVVRGDALGTARERVHFGARAGDEYLDPTVLLGGGPPSVHLVPADQQHPLHEWQERRDLIDGIGGVLDAGVDAVTPVARLVSRHGWALTSFALDRVAREWTRIDEGVRAWAHAINAPLTHDERIARRTERVLDDQRDCTPTDVDAPAAPGRGRIAILVAGLGSSGGGGDVLDVDTAALGYESGRVAQLSYAGGQSPGDRTIPGIETHDYSRSDTYGDLRDAGARLRELLVDVARAHPGVPVDLIAHSQGGIVVRAGLTGADTWAPDMPVIANVVTLGTPHHGAVPATIANIVVLNPTGDAALDTAEVAGLPTGDATRQLASSSHLVDDLGERGLPAGTRVTSIAASGDLTVDAQMSAIDGATNVVIPLTTGRAAHGDLPGHPETARELALALGGLGPACRDLGGDLAVVDAVNLVDTVAWAADRAQWTLARLGTPADQPVHSQAAPGGNGPPG